MAKIQFDFSLDGWMFTDIEADTLEECRAKLYSMTFAELLENGFMKSYDIKNVDEKILEKNVTVEVTSVCYEEDDAHSTVDDEKLPQHFTLVITNYNVQTDNLDYLVEDAIYDLTKCAVDSCEYNIINEY